MILEVVMGWEGMVGNELMFVASDDKWAADAALGTIDEVV